MDRSHSSDADSQVLFRDAATNRPLTSRGIADRLRGVIEAADPGHAPRAHDVRGVAASLAFLRTHSLDKVREGGQWSTASCFVARYLFQSVSDSPCVALGFLPPGRSQVIGEVTGP